MSSQVTFIYIALFTIEIVSKQLHSDNRKIIQHRSIIIIEKIISTNLTDIILGRSLCHSRLLLLKLK